ncbi:MAG: MOFRL family protein, partial [Haloarculaceae archaeon]
IASGPTAPDTSTFADALDVLAAYDVDVPAAVRDRLERGRRGDLPETPGPDHEAFDRVTNHVLVENFDALAAARDVAATRGYEPLVLSSRVRGEAREAGLFHAAVAEECLATGNPVEPPAVLLSGGETTVTIRGDGIGGPNQEFALQAGLELRGREIVVAGVDTDGIDGATDVAGALLTGETVADAAAARAALADNDVYPYLDERGAVVRTGPTGTNINDLRIVVVA